MIPLQLTEFGNPILREPARRLTKSEILGEDIQMLITKMKNALQRVDLGIGLAAPQVGKPLALAIIMIRPTKSRPRAEEFNAVLINPEIIKTFGSRQQLWEGCISSGKGKAGLFAKVPRYKKIQVKFIDQTGKTHIKTLEGLQAHVVQHEVDHLNGILFVDKVKDSKTYMTYNEYMKRIKKSRPQNEKHI